MFVAKIVFILSCFKNMSSKTIMVRVDHTYTDKFANKKLFELPTNMSNMSNMSKHGNNVDEAGGEARQA